MAQSLRTNPFYVLLVVTGLAFAITACGFGVMTFTDVHGPELLDALGAAFADLSVADRVGVISDLFALARAGYHSATLPLNFATKYLQAEESHVVLAELAAGLGAVQAGA